MRILAAPALVLCLAAAPPARAAQGLTFPPNGDNSQASVTQAIGPVRVTVAYSSPRVVRGKNDRRGHIWGELVPYGLSDLGLNGCTACPWRAGANENTTFTTTHDVKVEGRPLAAGTYGVHMIPGEAEWTVVFSKDASSWGSFWYDPLNDALRVPAKPAKSEYHEWLTYEFVEREPARATLALEWEELKVPIRISVENVDELWVEGLRRDLRQWPGFSWRNWQEAADFCADRKMNLPEALRWAERAASADPYIAGTENFATLFTLSRLQALNGRPDAAAVTFRKAIEHPSASLRELYQAGRQLLAEAKKDDALSLFQIAARRYSSDWHAHLGLMRAYAALGDTKRALAEGRIAAEGTQGAMRKNVEALVARVEKGEKID
jgi:hypothetical protein